MMVFAKKIAFYLLALSFLLLMVQVPAIDGQDAAKTGTEERVADPRVEPEEEKDEKDTEFYEGTVAQAKDTMHQVSVRKKEIEASMGFGHGHFCGGSLISWNIVLSAGVCFHRKNISNIVIVMGNVNRFEKANSLSFDIANVTLHPDFKPETIENDIAMVVLKDHVSPTESSVHPIELDSNPVESGKMCELTGWGESNTVHISEELRTVSVKALDFKGCGKLHTVPENLLHKGHMCAKMPEGGKGSCTADSGGPMVCGGVLSGIVASGVGQRCTAPGLPAVVSEMNYYLKWIDEELKKICCSGEKVIKKKKGKSSNSGVVGLRNRNLPLTGCLVVFTLLVAALS